MFLIVFTTTDALRGNSLHGQKLNPNQFLCTAIFSATSAQSFRFLLFALDIFSRSDYLGISVSVSTLQHRTKMCHFVSSLLTRLLSKLQEKTV